MSLTNCSQPIRSILPTMSAHKTDTDFRSKETVKINYAPEFGVDEDSLAHDGRYVPDNMLPFTIDQCNGTRFDLDGTSCELLGDLGGHAVYRRMRSKSTIRTMDWEDFVVEYERGRITINN